MKPVVIPSRKEYPALNSSRRILLTCGILSSILYAIMNIVAHLRYEGYSSFSQTVSELSAIDAPTRPLWVSGAVVYSLLVIAFGFGLWFSAGPNKWLRRSGFLFIMYAVIGFFWPPMHQREVLAAGGGTVTDTLHLVFTAITVPIMMLAIGFGAAAFNRPFRIYSVVTIILMMVFGFMTGLLSPGIETNQPTPWIGVWERIVIGLELLWVVVLAINMLRGEGGQSKNN